MRRFVVAVCLLAHSTYGLPQRGVQLGGGPRPVTQFTHPQQQQQQGPSQPPPNFGPSYSQQLTFGPSDAGLRGQQGGPGGAAYRSPQPILLQQGSPSAAPPSFAGFPSPQFGGGPTRGPVTHARPTTASPADDEYEEYEDDEESPKPQIQVTGRPIQRAPVRVSQPIAFSQGPQRLLQQAPARQRQPVPQRQPLPSAAPQYAPQPQPQPQRVQSAAPLQQQSRGQQVASFGLDGKRTRLTTPPPIQTVNRYMRNNDDGSITWGYENEDGTFKEETIGADCVVRGKYGYVDPDGQKREYEYQSGNPCDPNKKNLEEEEEEAEREGPGPQQKIQGVINAPRPRPQLVQQQQVRRPVPQQQQQQQYTPQYA
ncbi:atherin isoform X2 [Folsomia candida]|uniref:atherin isoform X2 n=1 Tax=Folsomia candida TaxID=158441 RepID=UPI000B909F9A|nr:atherin isoform X2 [Folsomia candida]